MRFLFSTSIPNFKLERSQLQRPLVIPYDIPYWKKEELINLLFHGFREKNPLILEINWDLIEKELKIQQHPHKVSEFRLMRNEIIITEIETEEQFSDYNNKYNRLPVLLTIAILKNPKIRAPRKWISDLKVVLVESVQKTIFENKLIELKSFSDFPFSFVLQNFEDPIDCIDFLNRAIKKRTLQIQKSKDTAKIEEELLQDVFCEMIVAQLLELNTNELKFLYSFALTCIPEEISDLTSLNKEEIQKIAEGLSSKGFVHIYNNLLSPTAPLKKLSEPKFFEKIGKLLKELTPDKFNSTEKVYLKILQSMQPVDHTFSSERNNVSNISTTEIIQGTNIPAIKDLIKAKMSEMGLDNSVDVDDTERLQDTCSRILWKERDEKKRKILFSARSLANLIGKNIENSLKDSSMIKGDEDYTNILRRLLLENSKELIIQGKWDIAIEIVKEAIEISKNKDEIYGNLTIQLGSILENRGEYDKAFELHEESVEIFKKIQNEHGIATSLYHLGIINQDQGNHQKAMELYNESLKIFQHIEDKGRIATIQHQLGIIHQDQGNYQEARKLYKSSLKMFKNIGDESGTAMTLQQLGIIHQDQGDYQKAMKLYNRSLKTFQYIGDKSRIAVMQHQIGNIHYLQGNLEEAVKLYNQSLKIFEEMGNKNGIAHSFYQIGMIYHTQGNFEEAVKMYNKSLEIEKELKDRNGIANSLHQLGIIHQNQDNYGEAAKIYTESLEIFKELGNKSGIAGSLYQLGMIYQNQGNYEEAIKMHTESLKIEKELKEKNKIANLLYQIGVIYHKQNNYKKAEAMYNESMKIMIQLGDKNRIATILFQLGRMHEEKQEYRFALICYHYSKVFDEQSRYRELLDKDIKRLRVKTREKNKRFSKIKEWEYQNKCKNIITQMEHKTIQKGKRLPNRY